MSNSQISLQIQQKIQTLLSALNDIVLDKQEIVRLAVTCIFANGHLLLQDLPSMGKTTLAHALAKLLGLDFNRVQFTNDMLPADILGMMVYHKQQAVFEFRQGAIFTQLLLADEINRSSPKTQSALLEAMEEKQVTQDGKSYELPKPFFVIATQNPSQQVGVYPLPESQLDRFLMCLSLGYPSPKAERELLEGKDRRAMVSALSAVLTPEELQKAQEDVGRIYMSDMVLDYIQKLVAKTRSSQEYHGLSPRGVLALKRACQAYAYIGGYNNVAIDDVQAVFSSVANHRLGQKFVPFHHLGSSSANPTIAERILAQVAID